MNEVLVAHGKKVERDLVAAANAPPDEALLAKMVSGEVATLLDLQELQAQVARRAVLLIDSSESMLLMVKALRELGPVLTSMSGRVTATLAASASLRAQRRFLEKNPSE